MTGARSSYFSMAIMDLLHIPMHSRMFRQGRIRPQVVWHLELGLPVRRSLGLKGQLRRMYVTLLPAKLPSSTVLLAYWRLTNQIKSGGMVDAVM